MPGKAWKAYELELTRCRKTLKFLGRQANLNKLKTINWPSAKHREGQNICVITMKFLNRTAPAYADEIFLSSSTIFLKPCHLFISMIPGRLAREIFL